ncbi:MAG TPA: sulfur carrier protein ThiS [Thermomicrobiales bacterium]|jgi:thiazole synthase|nr:sulfur carrier protein ThiS [Thermomicrobiales bacterium]
MNLTVNNEHIQMENEARTISSFLEERDIPAASIVVAVNDDVIPRSEWDSHELKDGDVVDIVQAVSGGDHDEDALVIAGQRFSSRLFVGTGKYPDSETMVRALDASGTEMVTVAIRFMNLNGEGEGQQSILEHLDLSRYRLLPNTAGAYTVKDAVKMARLARAATGTEWIKLEVIGDKRTLWPDVAATVEATKILVDEGFVVLPYTSPDLVAAMRLEEAGAATVMPLASPIGSGAGMQDWKSIERIVESVSVPVVVDAGIGVPSDAALAMELGADAVLVNTAVAKAGDPVRMARAMKLGTEAGRLSFLAGRMPVSGYANPSSPTEGVPVAVAIE